MIRRHINYILFGFLLLIILFILANYLFDFTISESTFYYLFSSLLQANAAILSIVGVFIIFRIQNIQSSIDIIKQSLMADQGRFIWPSTVLQFENQSLEQKKTSQIITNPNLLYQKDKWIEKEELIYKIRRDFKLPLIYLAIGIIILTICLSLIDLFSISSSLIKIIIINFSIYNESITMLIIVKFILKSI
jgi:hypothetical protein